MTVTAKTIPDDEEFIGQTESFQPIEVRSQVTGIIKKVFFTEGRDVRKGDRLYRIDPVPFRASVISAKGQVGQALARLARARAELARVKPLLAEQAVSRKDVDNAIAEKFSAKSALVTAKGNLEKATFDLRNTLIVVPVAGRLGRSRLYEGQLVSAQTDLLTKIHQMDPIYVTVNVPEIHILRRRQDLAARRVELPNLFQLKGIMTMADGTIYPHEGTLDFALVENNDLKQAVAAIEEFEARLSEARTGFIPQIEANAKFPALGRTAGGFRVDGVPGDASYSLRGNLAWELDVWGRLRRSTETSRAELLAREENRRAVVLRLVSGVAQAYFDLLQFDMQVDIAKRTLQSWEESVRIAEARLRGGITARLDADQFEAERANAAARVARFTRMMIQKENELSVLLGKNPTNIQRGKSLTEQVMPPDVPAGLPSELLQRRPDVLQAEHVLAAATARIGVAKAARFPKVTLTGILGVASPRLSNLLTSEGTFGNSGFDVAGPLLNANALGFQQDAAEARARQSLAQYQQTILVAFKEVEDALVAVHTARKQRHAQIEQVEALRSALRLANLRYRGGVTNYLDVLIAKRSLFDAELALTETHRLHLVSVVQLYKALGGGWSDNSSA